MSDNITLPRDVVQEALAALEHARRVFGGYSNEIEALRAALAAPKPEPVAYFDLQKQVFYWAKPTMIDVPMIVALKPFPLYAAAAAAAPETESKTPAWWRDGLAATLMREGVNKHRAREIAVGYWEAYCQIPKNEEDIEECWVANLPRGDKT